MSQDIEPRTNMTRVNPVNARVQRAGEPSTQARPEAPTKVRGSATVAIWVLSSPVPVAAIIALAAGRVAGFAVGAVGYGLIVLAALLTRRGLLGDPEASLRRWSRRWRLPWRNLGAAALAAGTGVLAFFGADNSLAASLAFAAVSVVAFHLLYGLEPMTQGAEPLGDDREARAVAAALAEAEDRLINIERTATLIGNPELRVRLGRIAKAGRGILEQIAARPSDLRRARRFLTVFLEGAEQVSDGYARTHRYSDSAELEQSFRTVLITIEDQFKAQSERLRQADVLNLDVQIEVLKKQLAQEGFR